MTSKAETELADADFFWALRQLQAQHPDGVRIGESMRLREDWIRLRQAPHFSSTGGPIERYTAGRDGEPDEMRVRFMGLFGPNGGLPLHLTEAAADRRLHARDETLWRFIDLFHHRMLSLFFRSWAIHQPTVDLDRPNEARFPGRVGALIGVGQDSLCARGRWGDLSRLYFAGHLSRGPRNAGGLERMIEEYFGVPTEVIPFQGRWIDLPAENRCRLGQSLSAGMLGRNLFAGEQVWECQTAFRIRLGPMRLADLERFLPGTDSSVRLGELVRFYVGLELAWDVQCVLRAEEVPPTRLGATSRLGRTTWLTSQSPLRNAEDYVMNFEERAA